MVRDFVTSSSFNDCIPDMLCHEEVAVFRPDAHQHVAPVFHGDVSRIGNKFFSVPVQQLESVNPMFVVHGFIRQTLDLLQCSVCNAKASPQSHR